MRLETPHAKPKATVPRLPNTRYAYLYSLILMWTDALLSTQGNPSNTDDEVMPKEVRQGRVFPARPGKVWQATIGTDLMQERHFALTNMIRETGETISGSMKGWELGLHSILGGSPSITITLTLRKLCNPPCLRRKYRLQGFVQSESSSNILEQQWVRHAANTNIPGTPSTSTTAFEEDPDIRDGSATCLKRSSHRN